MRIDYVTKAMETKGCGTLEIGEYSDFNWRKAMYNFPQMDVYFVRFLPERVQRFISDGKNYGFIQYAGTTLSIPANSAERTI